MIRETPVGLRASFIFPHPLSHLEASRAVLGLAATTRGATQLAGAVGAVRGDQQTGKDDPEGQGRSTAGWRPPLGLSQLQREIIESNLANALRR